VREDGGVRGGHGAGAVEAVSAACT
jgi:hypothetical protein